jgi:hypothetical protein
MIESGSPWKDAVLGMKRGESLTQHFSHGGCTVASTRAGPRNGLFVGQYGLRRDEAAGIRTGIDAMRVPGTAPIGFPPAFKPLLANIPGFVQRTDIGANPAFIRLAL